MKENLEASSEGMEAHLFQCGVKLKHQMLFWFQTEKWLMENWHLTPTANRDWKESLLFLLNKMKQRLEK